MIVAVDSSVLVYLVYPDAPAPIDPATEAPVAEAALRVEGLLDDLDSGSNLIVIPTPVLSELLIKAEGRETEILATLTGKRAVLVGPFDLRAAVENAALRRRTKLARRSSGQTKNEVRFDLQILAISAVHRVDVLFTDDVNLRVKAALVGMPVRGIADLPIPDALRQVPMELRQPDGEEEGDIDPATARRLPPPGDVSV